MINCDSTEAICNELIVVNAIQRIATLKMYVVDGELALSKVFGTRQSLFFSRFLGRGKNERNRERKNE